MLEILRREAVYLWYYFDLQLRQIFGYWAVGIVLGSCVSVFAKGWIHAAAERVGRRLPGVVGLLFASALGIASPLCMYGTIPLCAAFSRKGVKDDFLAAFMMSSILLNPQLIIYSTALGGAMLAVRIASCFVCGIAAGFIVRIFFCKNERAEKSRGGLKIINYFDCEKKGHWKLQIARSGWSAANFLVRLLDEGTFFSTLGEGSRLYLLTKGDALVSYATLSERDCVSDETKIPWIGFVFTFPKFRGKRHSFQLIDRICEEAANLGYRRIFIATDHTRLYEKCGFAFAENRTDIYGGECRVLVRDDLRTAHGGKKKSGYFDFSSFDEPGNHDTDPNILLRLVKNIGRNIRATALWFLLGVALSALFQRYVPAEKMAALFGKGNEGFGLLMAATVGVPLYVCGGGTIPLLMQWLSDGMSAGSAAAFMITGPATKITNLGALKIALGARNFALYVAFVIVFSLACGAVVNAVM